MRCSIRPRAGGGATHRARNLFDRVVAFDDLKRAYHGARRGLRTRYEVQAFDVDLEPNLWRIRRELVAGEYRWGDYRRFRIRDPKPREIRAAPFRDRVVHHAIVNHIDPLVRRRLIADTYACIPERGTHRAVLRLRSFARARGWQGHVFQGDIRSYFASVDHAVLGGLLRRVVGDRRLLALLDSLIHHGAELPGRGMPIGNLTSQLLANLYLDSLDHFVKQELRVPHYVRYMDDFILLVDSASEARQRRAEIEGFLRERLRLTLNPRRIVIAPLACPRDFLGYVHHAGGRVRVRRRSVRRLWRRIPLLAARLETGDLAWASARSSLASWQGLARYADAFRLSRAIFTQRDVRNLGKRLLLQATAPPSSVDHAAPQGLARRTAAGGC